jgi:hypothetical protein
MPVLTWMTHHRFWILGLGVTTLLVAVAAGVWFFLLRSPGTQVDLRQALRLYRQDQHQHAKAAGNALLPPPGVYRYRTSGSEQLSIGGINRSYPATTEMVVTDTGCATIMWDPLEQHTEGVVVCSTNQGALTMTTALSNEEIAGTHVVETYHCPTGAYFVPPHSSPGERWKATCHGMGQRVDFSGQVIGMSEVKAGGLEVPAIHTRLTLSFAGAEAGTDPTDYWVSTQDALILAERESVHVKEGSSPLGSVFYSEHLELAIDSTAPIR